MVDAGSRGRSTTRLTRRYHFSASHRAVSAQLSDEDNRRIYGRSSQSNGHNYVLSVVVRGEVDGDTGMVMDIPALDRAVHHAVITRLDHTDLNRDPDFGARPTTGENLTALIWTLLVKALPPGSLERIALEQTRDLAFEYSESAGAIR